MKSWAPILKSMREDCNIYIKFSTEVSIGEFDKKVKEGAYDFVYANPIQIIESYDAKKYTPILKEKNNKTGGILVTRSDLSKETLLENMIGKRIAFPSNRAFRSSMLIRTELNKLRIDYETVWVKRQENGYMGVLRGDFDMAGGDLKTFKMFLNHLKAHQKHLPKRDESLQVVWESPSYSSHGIAANRQLDNKIVTQVREHLSRNKFINMWKKIGVPNGMEQGVIKDWDDIRKIYDSINSNMLNISLREKNPIKFSN